MPMVDQRTNNVFNYSHPLAWVRQTIGANIVERKGHKPFIVAWKFNPVTSNIGISGNLYSHYTTKALQNIIPTTKHETLSMKTPKVDM